MLTWSDILVERIYATNNNLTILPIRVAISTRKLLDFVVALVFYSELLNKGTQLSLI